MSTHRGSSLVFLAFSVIAFIIIYGLMFSLTPVILGAFWSIEMPGITAEWQQTRDDTEEVTRWLIPLMATIGLMILVIKVLMVATTRGRD